MNYTNSYGFELSCNPLILEMEKNFKVALEKKNVIQIQNQKWDQFPKVGTLKILIVLLFT